ncbi:hypothetical protein RhiirA5_482717 [Rhizophagus irregularis]|uniref:Uncharacterized protein n=1 Tax=Rhizophagus irregularis TaxID=588596 RepID=A0A2N0PI18_9GLOM|nr:hypothetical protein RhiirA5_482717 [Rhizophagus irregularis]
MAHGFDLDFTEIINDGNNHLQQPTNVNQMEHTRMEHNQMEHNQLEHTPNVPYNNNFNISRDPSDTTTYTTGNYEESSSLMDNQLANLDLQNLFPQDSNPNIVTESSQTYSQNTFDLNDSFDFNNFSN